MLMVCALRFFYTHTLHRKVAIERIPFPRRERKLPLILSRDEVKALLEAPHDLRHRAMLAILMGAGLRVSEVARLKVADIDSSRNVLWVRSGKGRKDRQALLPPKLRELLRCYWRTSGLRTGYFPAPDPSQPISVKAIFLACRKAARKLASPSPFIRTCCGTPSPPTCSKPALISAPFRSCSDMPTSKRPHAICKSPT